MNKKFDFEEIIFADRYMIENKVESEAARNEVIEYRKIIKLLDEKIRNFKNFEEKINIIEVFQATISILQSQNN